MEIKEIGKWDKSSDLEVFFDGIFEWFIVKNKSSIMVMPISLKDSVSLDLDKESKEICASDFLQLRIHLERNLICCLTQQDKLVITT